MMGHPTLGCKEVFPLLLCLYTGDHFLAKTKQFCFAQNMDIQLHMLFWMYEPVNCDIDINRCMIQISILANKAEFIKDNSLDLLPLPIQRSV